MTHRPNPSRRSVSTVVSDPASISPFLTRAMRTLKSCMSRRKSASYSGRIGFAVTTKTQHPEKSGRGEFVQRVHRTLSPAMARHLSMLASSLLMTILALSCPARTFCMVSRCAKASLVVSQSPFSPCRHSRQCPHHSRSRAAQSLASRMA